MTLQINKFTASDERVLCWGRTLLALETNAFNAGGEHFSTGDEHFSAGDEHVENARSTFSHTHTHSYERLPSRIYVEMIII